jgi:hypothetical protein
VRSTFTASTLTNTIVAHAHPPTRVLELVTDKRQSPIHLYETLLLP